MTIFDWNCLFDDGFCLVYTAIQTKMWLFQLFFYKGRGPISSETYDYDCTTKSTKFFKNINVIIAIAILATVTIKLAREGGFKHLQKVSKENV